MTNIWTWNDMLDRFRELGGKADNIEIRKGIYGYGVFPIDPAQQITMHIPPNLLIPCEHVSEQGDDLVVSPDSGVSKEAREFFTHYERNFAWGVDARQDVEKFHKQFVELPDVIVKALAQIGIEITHPLGDEWHPLELFKMTRSITRNGKSYFMPVIDLLNHSREGPGFDTLDGVRITGSFLSEVFVHYGPADSIGRFFCQEFICDEPVAFSLSMSIPINGTGKTLRTQRKLFKKQSGMNSALPVRDDCGEVIILSHLMLGNERIPRMPRTLFRKLFPELSSEESDELFQRVLNTNILLLVDLLETLDAYDNELADQLRIVARLQLRGLARSYGARQLTAGM